MTTLPKFTETEGEDDDNARAPLTSLIDLSDLRDEAARVMTAVTLTQLYDAVKRRDGEELTRKPDSYVANLLIDEASSVVVSDTLTTQIEKGREFRLSIELVTQFPEQMKEAGNREVHLNVLDNIDSPPVGKIAVDADIAEVLSYEALATVKDYPTIGLNDFVGWYIKRDHDDIEAIKAGYPQRDRVARLGRDYDEIHDRLERTLYPVTTNKTPSAFQRWEPCRYDKSKGATVWQDEPPTPGHANFRAVPAWGDIDLADDIKPQRGALDTETQTPSSERSTPTSRCMRTLCVSGRVYTLDSVGGAYIFGAPEATLPIADHFSDDPDALERVFDEFLNRLNVWLRKAEARVNERIDGAGDIIQPDWVNNKNRQYKPPLSVHADHDAVVTPITTDDVRYELRPFETVDDMIIEQAVSWAGDLTRVEHTDCVDSLVATLWPDLYEDHDGWRTTLEAWVEAERERERERERQREAALQRREERLAELDGTLEPHYALQRRRLRGRREHRYHRDRPPLRERCL
jgi:hypothetical protein